LHLQSEKEYGSTFYFDVVFKAEHGHAQEWGELQGYKNILIVDDNDSNRIILKDMLALRGIQSDEASGSRQALQKLQQGLLYDAIIIDYCMPDMTGIETIQQIRKNGMASSQCPIVLLYSSADDAYINAACEQLDVQQRMVKPIKLNQLYHTLSLLKSQNNNISLAEASTIPALTTLPGEPLPKPEIKILIAEDHKINMALCKIFIRQIMPGAQIIEAENGQEAVEKFISEKPAMILMDIQMPQMDGYDACAAIRQYEVTPRVPIIALTAGTVKGEREKCLAAGMNDFVSKPFAKDTLSQVMSQWISLN
jgi:CheY-like chemotaxis protein